MDEVQKLREELAELRRAVKGEVAPSPDLVLPADFDGTFRFTNWTDNEFKARWDKVEYTFPANSTSPLVIPTATPYEVQSIRKRFAKELALQEFYKTGKFKAMENTPPGGTPPTYSEMELKDFIQKCLEPLPTAQAKLKRLPKDSDANYRIDENGDPRSIIMTDKDIGKVKLTGNGSALVA